MASNGSAHTQTLQKITYTKLDELEKKRMVFDEQRHQTTEVAAQEQDAVRKVAALAQGMRTCFAIPTDRNGRIIRRGSNNRRLEVDLKNLDRFLSQARYDPSISTDVVEKWQQTLLRHLDVQSVKYEYASLYGKLTKQWLSAKESKETVYSDEDVEMSEYEHISGGKKLESRREWEHTAFEPANIDKFDIKTMLRSMFAANAHDSKNMREALKTLRNKVEEFEQSLAEPRVFNSDNLPGILRSLLASDLLSEDKRDALRNFAKNSTILDEIADVLNMRMTSLDDWSWGEEVLLEPRRQLNGNYNFYMDEDLLQAIFLQYIGLLWSTFWKNALRGFRASEGVWKGSKSLIHSLDQKRREYYLGPLENGATYNSRRQMIYRQGYFLSQLLDHEFQERYQDEGDEEAEPEVLVAAGSKRGAGRTKQTARKSGSGAIRKRQVAGKSARYSSQMTTQAQQEQDEDEAGQFKPTNVMDAKQRLLHLLSSEILINMRLHGGLTCFKSQIDWLYPSLPHEAVERVLEFFGVSKKWLDFIDRFLKAPLRFADDDSTGPRQRRKGMPGSHSLSEVFGEIVMFCLDFQINQETAGEVLWRTNDDFWFWSSSHSQCEEAWAVVSRFVDTMGLQLNDTRSGAVRMTNDSKDAFAIQSEDVGNKLPRGQIRWGMLYLNPNSGCFEIDQSMVDHHIQELARQLKDKTSNVFGWIKAWNSYAATFFTSNFGKPANCFGRQHIDSMLATHRHIQRGVFVSPSDEKSGSGSLGSVEDNVIGFLRRTIEHHFEIRNIPDGYFYFPSDLGGLEVRNTFIGLLGVRDAVTDQPSKLVDDFLEAEKEAYKAAKTAFREGKVEKPREEMLDPKFKPESPETFFSFEEFTKCREQIHFGLGKNELAEVLTKLLERPVEGPVDTEDYGEVDMATEGLDDESVMAADRAEPYWLWVAHLYGKAMIEKFGGLQIVEAGLLPMGMVSLFRSGRVDWHD
ncbi:MAG: hypothetical protein Q9174_003387 [Haloplaca sp. 1 TL-2023]